MAVRFAQHFGFPHRDAPVIVYMLHYRPRGGPLSSIPRVQSIDARESQIRLVDETPEPGLSAVTIDAEKKRSYLLGRPIRPENVPTKLSWSGKGGPGDYFTTHAFPCVSQEFREIIERLEPNVHQFFPVEVLNRRGERIKECWLWVVCQRIDSVDRAKTTMVLHNESIWIPAHMAYKNEADAEKYKNIKPVIVFNSSQVGDRHFWRDSFLIQGLWCSSDAAKAIEEAGLVGIELIPKETV